MKIDDILIKQLKNWWDINGLEEAIIRDNTDKVLKFFYHNIKDINAKRCENLTRENPINPLHSVQWAVFLYKFSYLLFLDGHEKLASQVYYLNKIMHSNDWFYEVELPMHFYAEHPLGSVLGRAKYGDYFFIYQGCTVGGNRGGYPEIGKHVLMFSDSKILGLSKIGDNVIVSANTYIKDEDVPSNVIVFGQSPNLCFKPLGQNAKLLDIWKCE